MLIHWFALSVLKGMVTGKYKHTLGHNLTQQILPNFLNRQIMLRRNMLHQNNDMPMFFNTSKFYCALG